jgi:hypothetical protein
MLCRPNRASEYFMDLNPKARALGYYHLAPNGVENHRPSCRTHVFRLLLNNPFLKKPQTHSISLVGQLDYHAGSGQHVERICYSVLA